MAITTTDSIKEPKASVCTRCGHAGGLLTITPNRELVHWDDCPDGPAPEEEPVLFAHDPLSPGKGADVRALKRLAELGHPLTTEKQTLSPISGRPYPKSKRTLTVKKLEDWEAAQSKDELGFVAPETMPDPVDGGSAQKPLGKKPKSDG